MAADMTTPSASPVTLDELEPRWLSRCDICGWPLAKTVEDGCVEGNCSQRPSPEINGVQQHIIDIKRYARTAHRDLKRIKEARDVEPEPLKRYTPVYAVALQDLIMERRNDGGWVTYKDYAKSLDHLRDLLAAERGKNAAMKIDFDAQQSDIDRLLESLTNESNARVAAESRLEKVMEALLEVCYLPGSGQFSHINYCRWCHYAEGHPHGDGCLLSELTKDKNSI